MMWYRIPLLVMRVKMGGQLLYFVIVSKILMWTTIFENGPDSQPLHRQLQKAGCSVFPANNLTLLKICSLFSPLTGLANQHCGKDAYINTKNLLK